MAAKSQSAFGDYLDQMLRERRLSVREFARMVGVQSGVVSTAKRRTLNAERIERWANALKLRGPEREQFIQLAWLAHSPTYVRDLVGKLERENLRLRQSLETKGT